MKIRASALEIVPASTTTHRAPPSTMLTVYKSVPTGQAPLEKRIPPVECLGRLAQLSTKLGCGFKDEEVQGLLIGCERVY